MAHEHLHHPQHTPEESAPVHTPDDKNSVKEEDSFDEPWTPFEASLKQDTFFSPVTPIH